MPTAPTRYPTPLVILHWAIALLMISLVTLGLYMTSLDDSNDKWQWYSLHKSLGLTVWGLILMRVYLRFSQVLPATPSNLTVLETYLVHAVHLGLYVVMLVLPLSGYLDSVWGGYKMNYFGWFAVPKLLAENKALETVAVNIHLWSGYLLYLLFSLHLVGVLKHQFILKDGLLKRMGLGAE